MSIEIKFLNKFFPQLYNDFIEASKIEDCINKRLNAIRRKIRILPEENFETLRHLCQHLVQVIEHCETNKMEVRNLAIVFGPTLVRPADDNMLSMVTDMSHQCRIIGMYIITENWLGLQTRYYFNRVPIRFRVPNTVITWVEGNGDKDFLQCFMKYI